MISSLFATNLGATIHRAGLRDDFVLEPLISLNSGVDLDSVFPDGPEKGRKVFVPKPDWRSPSADELSALLEGSPLLDYSCGVFIFRMEDAAVAQFWDALDVDTLRRSPTAASGASERAAQPVIGNLQSSLFSGQARDCSATLVVNKGGLRTTTFSGVAGGFVGLHFDKLQADSLSHHWNFDLRLGINLGNETRHVSFSTVPVSKMGKLLGLSDEQLFSIYDNERHELVATFFEHFPDLPLARVTLPSGFGWAMVTQNVVHDGCSAALKGIDINLIVRLSSDWIHHVRGSRGEFGVPRMWGDNG